MLGTIDTSLFVLIAIGEAGGSFMLLCWCCGGRFLFWVFVIPRWERCYVWVWIFFGICFKRFGLCYFTDYDGIGEKIWGGEKRGFVVRLEYVELVGGGFGFWGIWNLEDVKGWLTTSSECLLIHTGPGPYLAYVDYTHDGLFFKAMRAFLAADGILAWGVKW